MPEFIDKILTECEEFFPQLTWNLSFQDDCTIYFGVTKAEVYQLCVVVRPLVNENLGVSIILWGTENEILFQVTKEIKSTKAGYPNSVKSILKANQSKINNLLPVETLTT